MKIRFPTQSVIESFNTGEVAELWAKLTEAAKADPEALAFLVMFEPWAAERLAKLRQ